MTPEQMRFAAAESAGWTLEKTNVHDGTCWHLNGIQSEIAPPDYHTDRNAMAELVESLEVGFDGSEADDYQNALFEIVNPGRGGLCDESIADVAYLQAMLLATALQQLEAYLKVKELWKA